MIYLYLTGVHPTSIHLMGGCHRRVSHGRVSDRRASLGRVPYGHASHGRASHGSGPHRQASSPGPMGGPGQALGQAQVCPA
jgi:hypothetical protein